MDNGLPPPMAGKILLTSFGLDWLWPHARRSQGCAGWNILPEDGAVSYLGRIGSSRLL